MLRCLLLRKMNGLVEIGLSETDLIWKLLKKNYNTAVQSYIQSKFHHYEPGSYIKAVELRLFLIEHVTKNSHIELSTPQFQSFQIIEPLKQASCKKRLLNRAESTQFVSSHVYLRIAINTP